MAVSGRPHPAAVLVAAAALVATGGCRSAGLLTIGELPLAQPPERRPGDTGGRPGGSAVTIPVEITFVHHDDADTPLGAELWTFLDEQSFDPDLRRQLAANGLRCGIVTGDLPAHLDARLVSTAPPAEEDPPQPGGTRRTLRLLPGRRADIIVAAARPELVLLEETGDGVSGRTFRDAGGFIVVRAWPASDGRVRIEAVPEVRHGPLRRSWVGEEGAFRVEASQARHRFDHLTIVSTLPAGGRLVIACDGDPATTVGDALLRGGTVGRSTGRRLLVIRPLAGGADPAFGGEEASRED